MKMKRIPFNRISGFSDPRFFTFEPVNSRLINFYLDGFKRREKNKEKPLILWINYITVFSYIVCIVKYLAGFKNLSYTTKLILFDGSILLGGIELYNRIVILLVLNMGLVNHIVVRWSKSDRHREWTQVFEMTRSTAPHRFIKLTSQIDNLMDLVKAMKVIYKIWNILLLVLGKIILSI